MTATRGPEPRRSPTSTVPAEDLGSLDLAQLRVYRRELEAEEDKVSYWRRLTHARIDLLEAQSVNKGAALSTEDLVRVLGDTATGRSRRALVSVKPAEPLPDLPDLDETWTGPLDPNDTARAREAVTRLRQAERQLTDYRQALHERIDEATQALIHRYRENPRAALDLIPQE